ncbi:MAG: hypothetical protein IH969_09205 [Candidatus Krumholzibacteriota bacterium]|nr:hypothetical protein [Candidatus Krumholzibacteriota bacterium]
MNRLREMLGTLERRIEQWTIEVDGVAVGLGRNRHQRVAIKRDGSDYVLTSVVLGGGEVTRNNKRWRKLARLVWRRNSQQEVVAFGFGTADQLIGQVRHPAEFLDIEELEFYIAALARECDRFEYLLTGEDRF